MLLLAGRPARRSAVSCIAVTWRLPACRLPAVKAIALSQHRAAITNSNACLIAGCLTPAPHLAISHLRSHTCTTQPCSLPFQVAAQSEDRTVTSPWSDMSAVVTVGENISTGLFRLSVVKLLCCRLKGAQQPQAFAGTNTVLRQCHFYCRCCCCCPRSDEL